MEEYHNGEEKIVEQESLCEMSKSNMKHGRLGWPGQGLSAEKSLRTQEGY